MGAFASRSSRQTRIPNENSIVEHITKHWGCQQECRQCEFHDTNLFMTEQRFNTNNDSFGTFRIDRLYRRHPIELCRRLKLTRVSLSWALPYSFCGRGRTSEYLDQNYRLSPGVPLKPMELRRRSTGQCAVSLVSKPHQCCPS